ncbi:hypothetical protein [Lactiplantibacillus plantarum]|uniref:hypothetical protein n=1 Tax=Lactiplantibacillus plantarum TaxID=1590 RepID=UPI0021CB11B4|nr:hypothetical protein [Lactiplantibacillus plantarum]
MYGEDIEHALRARKYNAIRADEHELINAITYDSVNNWKRVQKKPSLVAANDGLMEETIINNIYSIPKQSRLQVLRKRGR